MRVINKKLKSILMVFVFVMMVTGCGNKQDSVTVNGTLGGKTDGAEHTTQEPTTQEPTTEPFVPTEINIKMIGDILMHEGVTNSGLLDDGTYNYDHIFANVKNEIQGADIAIVNQEVILGGKELGLSGYPCFNGPFEMGDALVNAGFNVVLHATNHALDKGATGIDNCLNFWKTSYPDMAVLGVAQTKEESENIYVYEQNGIRIAILNYTYGTNGIALPTGREYMVNMLDENRIINDLKRAKEMSDFVIVCPHWGPEYKNEPWNEPGSIYDEVGWAKLMADNGADLIIAAHPHVIQPVEWIEGKDGNKTLCYYSLGNFVSNQDKAPRMLGAMADITISNTEDGQIYIKDYGVIPVVTHKLFGKQAITTYKLSDYTEELAAQNKIKNEDGSFSLQYCKDLCRKVFGDLYKE